MTQLSRFESACFSLSHENRQLQHFIVLLTGSRLCLNACEFGWAAHCTYVTDKFRASFYFSIGFFEQKLLIWSKKQGIFVSRYAAEVISQVLQNGDGNSSGPKKSRVFKASQLAKSGDKLKHGRAIAVHERVSCTKKHRNKLCYERHSDYHGWQEEYRCDLCSKTFVSKKLLTRHIVIHSDERPYICDVCGKNFKRPYEVTLHKKIHTEARNYICDICSYATTRKAYLEIHRKRHFQQFKVVCMVCGKGFYSDFKLKETVVLTCNSLLFS